MNNRASIEIPAKVAAEVMSLYEQIDAKLAPYLVNVPNDEKAGLLRLGDKTVPFVGKTAGYLNTAPKYAPEYLDKTEFKKDADAVNVLDPIYQRGLRTMQKIEDTRAIVGSEAFAAALVYYNYVKQAARDGIAEAKTIYEDLAKRFPGRSSK